MTSRTVDNADLGDDWGLFARLLNVRRRKCQWTWQLFCVAWQEHACSCTGKPLNRNVQRGTFGKYDLTTHMSQTNPLYFRFFRCIEGIVALQHFHPCTDVSELEFCEGFPYFSKALLKVMWTSYLPLESSMECQF